MSRFKFNLYALILPLMIAIDATSTQKDIVQYRGCLVIILLLLAAQCNGLHINGRM